MLKNKKFLKFANNKMLLLMIFSGSALIGFTTGNVIAQEVKIGDNLGTPFMSYEDLSQSGMYELRLNDGTGQFQIHDMTNDRNSLLISSDGKIAVGDEANPVQQFTIGCTTGKCNIMTRSFDNDALNTVNSVGDSGQAIIRLVDKTPSAGTTFFEVYTDGNGNACLGYSNDGTLDCMLIFDLKDPDKGQVKDHAGNCIANCP